MKERSVIREVRMKSYNIYVRKTNKMHIYLI